MDADICKYDSDIANNDDDDLDDDDDDDDDATTMTMMMMIITLEEISRHLLVEKSKC